MIMSLHAFFMMFAAPAPPPPGCDRYHISLLNDLTATSPTEQKLLHNK